MRITHLHTDVRRGVTTGGFTEDVDVEFPGGYAKITTDFYSDGSLDSQQVLVIQHGDVTPCADLHVIEHEGVDYEVSDRAKPETHEFISRVLARFSRRAGELAYLGDEADDTWKVGNYWRDVTDA